MPSRCSARAVFTPTPLSDATLVVSEMACDSGIFHSSGIVTYNVNVTGRLPFNPDDMTGPPPDLGAARRERAIYSNLTEARDLTVTQASELIRKTLEDRIPSPVRVKGEVSNLNQRSHWYFSLKDDQSVLSCVVWASTARRLRVTLRDGQEVVAVGSISHFGQQGRTQLYVQQIEPVGEGSLDQRFRALCDELRRRGYFDESRKRPLPLLPRRIAVITSRSGAAIADVRSTAGHRCAAVGLVLADVHVQGDGAAREIAASIAASNRARERLGIDAILITRGGGSLEDLWAFNERIVADAVYKSELPVVAAVGHESDTTVAELVADLRAATPTQAIMRLIPARDDLTRQIDHHRHRITLLLARKMDAASDRAHRLADLYCRAWRERFSREHRRLSRAQQGLEQIRPADVSAARTSQIAVLEDRLRRSIWNLCRAKREEPARLARNVNIAVRRALAHRREALLRCENELNAIDVHSVLRRGFSYATKSATGDLIRSIHDAGPGDRMLSHFADGSVRSTVDGPAKARSRKRSTDHSGDQLNLFRKGE